MTKEQFKRMRQKMGLTQKELGDKLDVTTKHISNLENGWQTVKKQTALAMKQVYFEVTGFRS